jgi:hypothetical protein
LIEQITADQATLLDRRCETSTGMLIHPLVVLQAALTCHVRRVVVDSAGVVVDLGRRQRLFTGSPRTAAQLLTRCCSHPGCDVSADFADVDHVDGWAADRGSTDQSNSDIKCGSHDRFKHRERWRTRGDARGRPCSLRPDGTIVLPVGERPPDLTTDEQARLTRLRLRDLQPPIAC